MAVAEPCVFAVLRPADRLGTPAAAGHLWVLGEHRLLCGDSSKPYDLDRLLDGLWLRYRPVLSNKMAMVELRAEERIGKFAFSVAQSKPAPESQARWNGRAEALTRLAAERMEPGTKERRRRRALASRVET